MSSWSIVPIAYEFLNTHSEASLDFPLNMLCSTTDSLETLKLRLRQRLTKIFKVPKCIIDKHYAVPLFTDNGGIDLVKFDFCHIGASRQCKHVVAKLLNTMCIDFVSACIYCIELPLLQSCRPRILFYFTWLLWETKWLYVYCRSAEPMGTGDKFKPGTWKPWRAFVCVMPCDCLEQDNYFVMTICFKRSTNHGWRT
jgi:hypothetical protein